MPSSSEPFRCTGRYFDGERARAAFADIATDSSGLIINIDGEELLWTKGLIQVEPSAGLGCDRVLRLAGGP